MQIDPVIFLWLRYSLACLFLLSIYHKLSSFTLFRQHVADYRLLPAPLVGAVSFLIISLEVCAVALLLWRGVIPGALLSAALLLLYACSMVINLARGRNEIDCGCTGPGQGQPISMVLVFRNVIMSAAALLTLLPMSGRQLSPIDFYFVLLSVGITALLYSAINQLFANYFALKNLRS